MTLQDSSSSLRISKDDNRNVPFAGLIDDARIYHRALSAAEIAYLHAGPNPPVTHGLKLHLDASDVNAGCNPADGAAVTTWRDLSGLSLDATPLFGVAPVYRTNMLNGRAGVDFGQSSSDALATAITKQLNFTKCTIFIWVGNVSGGGGFNGDIDDLRFWNRARTAQEIRDSFAVPLLGTEPGLVAYYPLDGTTKEVTGHGRDGMLMFKESFGAGADTSPVLQVDSIAGSQVNLSWLAFGSTHRVQTATHLNNPDWNLISGTPTLVNGRWTRAITASGNAQSFRLVRQ